jgi:transposase InsO family protein
MSLLAPEPIQHPLLDPELSEQERADLMHLAVVQALADTYKERGYLTITDYEAVGQMANRSWRTIRRWYEQSLRSTGSLTRDRHRARYDADDLAITAVYAHAGDIRAAYTQLCELGMLPESRGTGRVVSETTFRDALKRENKAVLMYPKIGHKALYKYGLYCAWTAPAPNVIWQVDSHKMSIWVQHNGFAIRPWLHGVVDDCDRLVPGALVSLGDARQEDLEAMFSSAMNVRLGPDEKTVIGGKPKSILMDNGSAYTSELVAEALDSLGIKPRTAAAYSPHQKGKIERFWRTFQEECLRDLPGYITPAALTQEGEQLYVPPDEELLPYEAVVEHVYSFLYRYNFERRHSALGCTPFEKRASMDFTMEKVKVVDPGMLDRAFLRTERDLYGVHPSGLHVHGAWYKSPAMVNNVGKQAIVRYPHGDDSFIAVFDDRDRYLGRAYKQLTPEQNQQVLTDRDDILTKINGYLEAGLSQRDDPEQLLDNGKPFTKETKAAQKEHKARKNGRRSTGTGVRRTTQKHLSTVPDYDDILADGLNQDDDS